MTSKSTPDTNAADALELRSIEVVYNDVVTVLRGVSLSVEPGAVVALLGANGAGKTTLLRAITGLLSLHKGEVTKGAITFGGRDLLGTEPPARVRSGIAQVLEGRRIFAELTIEENLKTGGYTVSASEAAATMTQVLDMFPILGERFRSTAGYLSGGEQQMLAIGRALMASPRLLLLDEPSLGLAPLIVEQIGEIIQRVNATGVSVLLVEQNASMALGVADRGYVMETGRIVKDGEAKALLADEDIREFYLGGGGENRRSFRDVKSYRRRKKWGA